MPEASRLDRRRETNSFHQSNMSQYVERYFHLLCVSGDMTLPYNLVYISNRIDKTRWLGKYHLCPTSMEVLSNHFQRTALYEQLRLATEMLEGKTHCCLFQRVMAQTDIYGALLKRNTFYFSKSSLKRHIWSATEITKGTCCVQQLAADAHNLLDVTHQ